MIETTVQYKRRCNMINVQYASLDTDGNQSVKMNKRMSTSIPLPFPDPIESVDLC